MREPQPTPDAFDALAAWSGPLPIADAKQWEIWFVLECGLLDTKFSKAELDAIAREISAYRRHELPSMVANTASSVAKLEDLRLHASAAWFNAVGASVRSLSPWCDSEDCFNIAQMAWDKHPELRDLDPYEAVRILEAITLARDVVRSR